MGKRNEAVFGVSQYKIFSFASINPNINEIFCFHLQKESIKTGENA